MRIERRRLRAINADEHVSAGGRNLHTPHRRGARPVSIGHVGDHRKRIDRADVDRSCSRNHQPRVETARTIRIRDIGQQIADAAGKRPPPGMNAK